MNRPTPEDLAEKLDRAEAALRESMAQQAAIGEVLRAIRSSPHDVEPVFDAIMEGGARLLGGFDIGVLVVKGDRLERVASMIDDPTDDGAYSVPLSDDGVVTCRAILERRVVHVPDIAAEDWISKTSKERAARRNFRAIVSVPMMRGNAAIGALIVTKAPAGPFTGRQVELLKTFAEHAVIAIDNVQMFRELEARTAALTRSMEQLRVLGTIGRAASSTLDLDAYLQLIIEAAVKMSGADQGTIYDYDETEQHFMPHATHGMDQDHVDLLRSAPFRLGEGAVGYAAKSGQPWDVADVLIERQYEGRMREIALSAGFRAVAAVPMVRGKHIVGGIVVRRREPGAFGAERIALLQVAAQSTLMLQNERLLREIEEKNAELEEAARLKTQLEARRMTEQLIEALPNPVFFKGTDGRYLGMNKAWESFFGIPRQEFLGKTVHELYPNNPEIADRLHAMDQVLWDKPGSQEYETTIRTRHGSEHQAVYYKATFTHPDGSIAGLIGTIIDITARKQAEGRRAMEHAVTQVLAQADTASEALQKILRTICESLGWAYGAYWRWDEKAELLRCAETWYIDAPELEEFVNTMGRRVIEAPAWRDGPPEAHAAGLIRGVWGDGTPSWVPDVTRKPGFRRGPTAAKAGLHCAFGFPVLSGAQPLGVMEFYSREIAEPDEGLLSIVQAVGAQIGQFVRRHESETRSSELEAASRHKSQFLANMSHELRTPMNAIIGVSEMMLEDARDLKQTEQVEPLERILRAAQHLLALINDILDLSKIEAGKMDFHPEHFDVAQLIRDVVATVQPMAEKNGNRVTIECAPDLGSMYADATRVRQALLNLASNAVKFTDKGTIAIAGLRHAVPGSETIMMQVRDTGIGMTTEQIGRLFQEFEQADASTTRKYGGTGLGLAISRRFCRMMGGDITVRSTPGRGSTFTIQLPAAGMADAEHETAVETVPERAPAPKKAADGAPTVLVVDDDSTVRVFMQHFLERQGYTVATAANGIDALARARELHPAAITLDVMMPDIDGWTVLAALKGDPQLADIPVILVTIIDEKQRGYTLGATDYLVKPVDRVRLAALLRSLCGRDAGRVLVVEDDETSRALISSAVEREGWTVVAAQNGRVALERVREARPDAILLDLMMPEMDGFEFLGELREHREWRAIPVIVVSALDLTPEDKRRLNGEVEAIIRKSGQDSDKLMREVSDKLARCIRQPAPRGAETAR